MPYMLRNSGFSCLLCLLLAACSSGAGPASGQTPQQWLNWNVWLETRPTPLTVGRNEFLIHVMDNLHHFPRGLIVRFRIRDDDQWIQAMPDGISDLYRRALTVNDPAHERLYVHLKLREHETYLIFPLGSNGSNK